ncbi:hypothetical protein CSA56_01595 [candidate division KSB3 bacterium]|uniref:Uncharacterized protein n=1 Tax=candidate division KSB3 bacterium TaxID=2044937 RepID=A0A2G6KKA0_9BACT|nr:MAG: hypothetical protein CSA56_01595 [candidate division KSB3 bacterium]
MKGSNPLNNIAANLGVTPTVLTQLATGDDQEFRELVRGILSMLPENEVMLVASDPEINLEFLEYLAHLFETNTKILLTILQNPASTPQCKHYIVTQLPNDVIIALLKNPNLPPEIHRMLTTRSQFMNQLSEDKVASSSQHDEFKIKMKVSRLLNDLEANLGLTIEAFLQIRAQNDEQSREFVREVYSAIPENDALIVSRDPQTSPKILDDLSLLFDTNHKVLLTLLHNPSTDIQTQLFILDHLPEHIGQSLAESPKTPPKVLQLLGEYFTSSSKILKTILQNPSTPAEARKAIEVISMGEELEEAFELPETAVVEPDARDEIIPTSDEVDAKIALCVNKLYDINADIVTEFIKQARSEIVKRLSLIANANRIILRTIVRHPSLSIEELEHINMDMFISLLKKSSPDAIDDEAVLDMIRRSINI